MNLLDFLALPGQERTRLRDEYLGGLLNYYLGPTGIPQRLGLVDMMNPVTGAGGTMTSSQEMLAPGRTPMERAGSAAEMLTGMAGVIAPAAAARIAGGDATQAMVEGLLGIGGQTARGLDDAARRFAADESGALTLGRSDPAIERGAEIMRMLRSGRASEVTDDMLDMGDPVLNARLNMYLFENYDLPMDEASRAARAGELGFDTGAPLYHGGASDFAAFDQASRGKATSAMSAKRATWMADDPDVAGGYATFAEGGPVQDLINRSYMAEADGDFDLAEDLMRQAEELELSGASAQGGNIQPLRARGNRLSFNADGEKYDANEYVMMDKVNEAQRSGYAGLQIDNFVDNADYSDWTEATHVGIFDPRNIRSRFARFDPRLAHLRNLSAGVGGLGLLATQVPEQQRDEEIRQYLGGLL